jgi:hypothetical protein
VEKPDGAGGMSPSSGWLCSDSTLEVQVDGA